MDALEKRREIRKRKILQNAEGRLNRVSHINVETTRDRDSREPSVLHTSEPNNAFTTFDHTLNSSVVKSEIDGEPLRPNGQEKTDLVKEDDSESKEEINRLKVQTDGSDVKEKIKCLDELQEGEKSENQETENRDLVKEDDSESKEEINRLKGQTDGSDVKEKIKSLYELQEGEKSENQETENRDANAPTMKNANSKLRIVLMVIFASLCFYQSTYWPLIVKITGLSGLDEEQQQSFLIPLCLLELFFFFIPSLRKVVPGQKANICLLGLKLSGVSPVVVENLQFIMLEILEFLTDLVIFIFVLVVLQNVNDLMY